MSKALVKQPLQTLELQGLSRSTQIGPLNYGEWDLQLISFFTSFSRQTFGESAAKVIQASSPFLIDQFLTVDQADLDAYHAAFKDEGLPKIDSWPNTLQKLLEEFNDQAASSLKKDPDELRQHTYSFLGLRAAQAYLNMKGEIKPQLFR